MSGINVSNFTTVFLFMIKLTLMKDYSTSLESSSDTVATMSLHALRKIDHFLSIMSNGT